MLRPFLFLAAMLACATAHAGFYSVTSTNDSGAGSLRQGVLNANASAATPSSPYVISITAPAGTDGTTTITLASALPNIAKPTLILAPSDGRVILQPSTGQRGDYDGLHFGAGATGSSVYFVTLRSFQVGVSVFSDDFTLSGCTLRDSRMAGFAATDAVGLTVGGNTEPQRNVFVENGWEPSNNGPRAGAWIRCTERDESGECAVNLDTRITGNFFGVERDGVTESGNLHYGLLLESVRGVTVGGAGGEFNGFAYSGNSGLMAREQSRNVSVVNNTFGFNGTLDTTIPAACAEDFWANYCDGITLLDSSEFEFRDATVAANEGHGIAVHGGVGLHRVTTSWIGTVFVDGQPTDLGNGGDGIHLDGGNGSSIGFEDSDADANTIAYNGGYGIAIVSGRENAIHPNSILRNSDDGIRIWPNANGNQPSPTITSLSPISGVVPTSDTGSGGIVYLFADAEDEGEFYIGSALVAGGEFSTEIDLSFYAGLNLTGISTRGDNSSRFSVPIPIGGDTDTIFADGFDQGE